MTRLGETHAPVTHCDISDGIIFGLIRARHALRINDGITFGPIRIRHALRHQ